MMGKLKEIFTKNLKNKIAASLILPDVKKLKQELDYNEYGGAPLMGTAKACFQGARQLQGQNDQERAPPDKGVCGKETWCTRLRNRFRP